MSRKYLHDLLDLVLNHKDLKLVDLLVDNIFEELEKPVEKIKPKIVSKSAPINGRPPKLSIDQIRLCRNLVNKGNSPNDIADILKVSRATIYRQLKKFNDKINT